MAGGMPCGEGCPVHERHPHDATSAIVAVNTSAAKFIERFPDFEEWGPKNVENYSPMLGI